MSSRHPFCAISEVARSEVAGKGNPRFFRLLLVCFLCCACTRQFIGQSAAAPSTATPAPVPQIRGPNQRPAVMFGEAEGLIHLDVLVTDNSGRPVPGLGTKDFTLVDNGQIEKILSFREFDGVSLKPDSPVEIILLIDTFSIPANLAFYERGEVGKFLRQNRDRLTQPVSIFGISENGLWTVAHPSSDGNTMADDLAHNREIFLLNDSSRRNLRGQPLDSLQFADSPNISALKALGYIATAERRKPGRKLLVWIGPGCGIGSGAYPGNTGADQRTFDMIYWFSTLLREARISICNLSVGESDPRSLLYLDYLNGVKTVRQASIMYLYKKVLAVESGGQVLDESSDLVKQIEVCVRDANAFYTLSFNPAPAQHKDEYHDLKVKVSRPGLTVRTNTGYYDQPYYSDELHPATQRVTVAQLEQVLSASRGESDDEAARQLSNVELTEQVSDAKLVSWTVELRGKRTRQVLTALADASAFLDPPPAEIPSDAPPDENAQRHMISLAADYLHSTMPRLPDFYAKRTSVRYEETPQYDEATTHVNPEPMHVVDHSKATVLYRNGSEVVEAKAPPRGKEDRYLITYGTFGPLLGAMKDAIAAPGGLIWIRWEQRVGGRLAVFRYSVPKENQKSAYAAAGCCLPDGDGTGGFEKRTSYHGEISIDPASGAILRLTIEADLYGFVPLDRSDIMVEYSPVEIGGKYYICPVRSVSIWRARSVPTLWAWNEGFSTWGPYATMLNDFTFDDYHMFRADSRMLSDFSRTSETAPADTGPEPPAAARPGPQ